MSLTVLSLVGPYSSTCGYCEGRPGLRSVSKSSHSYGIYPIFQMLPCSVYMDMLDRGWRRSGAFVYKPDMRRTCCPQYTIRLDALKVLPSRSQRQVTNRWNRFVLEGDVKTADGLKSSKSMSNSGSPPFELVAAIHRSEAQFISDTTIAPAHRFEVKLEPSEFSNEKFNLYQSYQREIHKEADQNSTEGFRRFLVDSPLPEEPIPYPSPPPPHLPKNYGTYHQCYRIDGELIAVAILDILPRCVSSVYFMYDKKWGHFSLGKISALREAALAREIHDAGVSTMDSLYLGFYIHSCTKMRYKGDYSPSYLLDPEQYAWFPLNECIPILEKHRYACFSDPGNSLDGDPGPEKPNDIPQDVLTRVNLLELDFMTQTPVTESSCWGVLETRKLITDGIHALGTRLAQGVTLMVN